MQINIWVREKDTGKIHQVGTDPHDDLIYLNGRVEYYNLQCGDGTPYGYEFVEAPDSEEYIEVTPEQLRINREMVHDELLKMIEESIEKSDENNSFNFGNADMELINKLARRKLDESEVYVFPVTLCDNETDRDCERFSVAALKKLSELFVGRTGIFDHDPKGNNQTARIYDTELATDPERVTRAGEPYSFVRAKAYMMKTDGNVDLIREIDGGIKKEVSVSCAVGKRICSICGADERSGGCSHIKGRSYGGKLCEKILDEPTDAYEWSLSQF